MKIHADLMPITLETGDSFQIEFLPNNRSRVYVLKKTGFSADWELETNDLELILSDVTDWLEIPRKSA
jgi:hypothetical protein